MILKNIDELRTQAEHITPNITTYTHTNPKTGQKETCVLPNVGGAGSAHSRTEIFSDLATDLYLVLNFGDDAGDKKIPFDDYTPEMRIDAYQKAIDIQLRLLEMQCGFSAGTFTFDVKTGKMTATQIISEDKDTYNTVKAIQESGMAQGLRDLVYLYDWYATLYSLAPAGKINASVTFGDSIFEDTAVEFSRRKQLCDGGYLKKEKLVGWYFGVSDEEAQKEYMPEEQTPDDILFGKS